MATTLNWKRTTTAFVVSVILTIGTTELHAQFVQAAPQRDHINATHQLTHTGLNTGGQFYDGGGTYPGGMHLQGQGFGPHPAYGSSVQHYNAASPGTGIPGYPGNSYSGAGTLPGNMHSGYGHGYGSGPGTGGLPHGNGRMQSINPGVYPGQSFGSPGSFGTVSTGMQSAQPWEMHRHWSNFHVPERSSQLYQMNTNEIRPQPTFGRR
ncbi:MAG: hypothetical protein AAF456_03445 [Planctomycetota bacterium]